MKKPKQCSQCGVARNLTLTANIHDAESGVTMGLKRLCVPCLLGVFRIPRDEMRKLSVYHDLMKDVEPREEQCLKSKR